MLDKTKSYQGQEMLPKNKKKKQIFKQLVLIKKEKGRIDMQPLLRIFRFCNPQRKLGKPSTNTFTVLQG